MGDKYDFYCEVCSGHMTIAHTCPPAPIRFLANSCIKVAGLLHEADQFFGHVAGLVWPERWKPRGFY